MLARRSTIQNKANIPVDLPRLVPSFSSKGFPFFKKGRTRCSEVTNALALTGPHLKQSFLISAYDIHHELVQNSEPYITTAELVFLDSGGYELAKDYDSTEPKQPPYSSLTFRERDYRAVIKALPKSSQVIVSNFDWATRKKELSEQLKSANRLFATYPQFLSNFIIKPGTRHFLDIDLVISQIKHMHAFDVIGVTEKELGHNLIDRLKAIAKLRAALDREHVVAPLHIWGGLDPVITPLYFFAGAEIFDGVSWLRYAYHRGMAVYRDSYGVLHPQIGVMRPQDHAQSLALGSAEK